MFTEREQINVLDNHHLFMVFIKDGFVQDICGLNVSFTCCVYTGAKDEIK